MSVLHRKLGRELLRMSGQALAIALVLASGVMTYVLTSTSLASLLTTQARYYSEYRFADLFVDLKRAPEHVGERLRDIDGVRSVDTRVVAMVNIDVPDFTDPVSALLVSLPDEGQPALNRIWVREGALPERADEVLISDAFADAQSLGPGDTLGAVINGRWQRLRISGVGASPEYIYQIKPGDLFFDFERFGILWMRRQPLATAFDLDGAFNNAVFALRPGADARDVIARIDDVLERYGGQGAYDRDDQVSHGFLDTDLQSLVVMSRVFPAVFFGVAAFLLNVVIARMLAAQREQIGILKAFGYRNGELALHYIQLVLVIVAVGSLIGTALGVWLGRGMAGIYAEFYRFPYLDYSLDVGVAVMALTIAALAALAGTGHAVLRAARLPPAEAMRPEPPSRYRRSWLERLGLGGWLDQPSRMVLRHLGRHPLKSAITVLGIAMSVAIVMLARFQVNAVDALVESEFGLAAREDLTVTFTEPTSYRAMFALAAEPGVGQVEPMRMVPARLRAGHREYRLAIRGLVAEPDLHRLLDIHQQPIRPPAEGLLLTSYLADTLGVVPGDSLQVEILEGDRPVRQLPVAGVVPEYIGMNAYMELTSLNRLMREGNAISGVYLKVDADERDRLFQRIKNMPRVAGVSIQREAVRSFEEDMAGTVLIFTLVMTLLAMVIAVGVVYNSARIALAERARELASMRVLGFRRAEISYILLGELALLTLLALPPGFLIGYGMTHMIATALGTELFRIPAVIAPSSFAFASCVVMAAAIGSALLIRRRLNRLDLIGVLKTRE
ncbi:MAG: ABC transporter permease [Gammaproteobacteria bacterium]|nr:ABC transporter permease [Gammaproteobacteria bacterium]